MPILSRALLNMLAFGLLVTPSSTNADHILLYPNGLALDQAGVLYISDIGRHQVLKWSADKELEVVAGTGDGGFGGDLGAARDAQIHAPHDLAFDAAGNLYVADSYNHRIRRIDLNGQITTVAGNGRAGRNGDGGLAKDASLNCPQGIALDKWGNLYIADTFNHVVRRVAANGIITTVAGTEAGLAGDNGPATKAQISLPLAVATDPSGEIYISDGGNSRVRKVSPDGILRTVVGTGGGAGIGGAGFVGDGGPADRAKIFAACDIECDAMGTLFISDSGNNRLRMVRYGRIWSIAGDGKAAFGGDGENSLSASLNTPQKIAIGADGTVFVADRVNGRVRTITPDGNITTIIGHGKPGRAMIEPGVANRKADDATHEN